MDDKWSAAAAVPWATIGGVGVLGRLMYHARQVQAGKRKPFTWALLWDIPIALGMGWLALGVGVFLHVPWETTVSIALAFAYLGPYMIDAVFLWYGKRFTGGDNGPVTE